MGSFFRGVVSGAAKSIDKNIQNQLKFLREEASSVARIRANRKIRDQEKYLDEENKMAELIKDLSKKAGGYNEVAFIFEKRGVKEGEKYINDLYEYQKKSGGVFNVKERLNVEQKDTGNLITPLQIARKYMPAQTVLPDADFSNLSKGIPKFLGIDPTKEIERQTSAMLEAAGVDDNVSMRNVVGTLDGKMVPEWELYRLDDPKKEFARLTRLSQELGARGEKENNQSFKDQAVRAKVLAETAALEVAALSSLSPSSKKTSPIDVNRVMADVGNKMIGIFNAKDVGSFVMREGASNYDQTESKNQVQNSLIQNAQIDLAEFYVAAINAGVSYPEILRAMQDGITSDPPQIPIINRVDKTVSLDTSGEPKYLIDSKDFDTAFPASFQINQRNANNRERRFKNLTEGLQKAVTEYTNSLSDNRGGDDRRSVVILQMLNMTNPETNTKFTEETALQFLKRF
mgnify:FL=1|tara:strand:+ start:1564 stop:2937 length:1374 start_codon:yes stop_codon:yes gene_type:complete